MFNQVINKETLNEYFTVGLTRQIKSTGNLKSLRRNSNSKKFKFNKYRTYKSFSSFKK